VSQVRLNFLNWRPDAEDFGNDGLTIATNVLHDTEGYIETRGTNTATTVAQSTGEAKWLDVVPLGYDSGAYVAATHWSTLNSVQIGTFGTWSEYADTAGAGQTAGALQSFSAVEFEDKIVACAKYHFASSAPVGTTTASGYISYSVTYGASSTWTDLPNSADGIVCGVINQFVMVGNDDTGIPGNNTVRWCAIGDATDWPTPATDDARAKQAGEEVLSAEFGAVTGIAGNDFFGYVFQEGAITKFTYVGGDVVFTVDPFEESRGCGYPQRLVQIDDVTFFESKFARHMLVNDQVTDIGFGRVDDTYPPSSDFYALKANPAISTVFFSNNLAYNYKTDQWTYLPNITPVLSINDITGIIGQWDNDSGFTEIYDSTGGTAETATITTGATDLNPGGRSIIGGVRPLINGGTTYTRVANDDSVTPTTRTNLLVYSEDWSQSDWSKTNTTITTDDTTAPDGRTTADKIEATAAASTSNSQTATGAGVASDMVFSIFVKQGSGATDANDFTCRNATSATNLNTITLDYSDGSFTQDTGSDPVYVTALPNSWWRIELVVTSGVSASDNIQCYSCFNGATETAGEYAYAWGAQLEAASRASGYIKTEAATASENFDYTVAQTVNSRTNMANFRKEGRYGRVEVTIEGGFTTAQGADIEFTPQGKV